MKNKKIVISLSLLALLFVAIIGVSYAYYMANVVGNNDTNSSMSLKSGYLSITYTDGTEFIPTESDGTITQDKAYTKTFTVTNSGVKEGYYSVWLKDIINPFERTEDWTYTLSIGDDEIISSTVFPTSDKEILSSRYIGVGESETLTLSVTYASSSENQIVDMNKTLEFNISVVQSISEWEKASEGTLLYAIKNSKKTVDGTEVSMLVSSPTSVPGQVATTSDEAEIASTEDDYGISYYYRGNVTNNYVNYSGMCWRIVRVQGDGTIKIILADGNGECDAETYSISDTTSAFIGNALVGTDSVMWSQSYGIVAFNVTSVVNGLTGWMTNKEVDTNNIVETKWCNDTARTSYDSTYGVSYYGAYDRLDNVSTANPTLECNAIGTLDVELQKKPYIFLSNVGILSADEVAFAGSTSYQRGIIYNSYLKTNSTGNFYWTMSYYSYQGALTSSSTYVYAVGTDNSLTPIIAGKNGATNGATRPAIVLKSSVLATTKSDTVTYGQPGTHTNPFVIS